MSDPSGPGTPSAPLRRAPTVAAAVEAVCALAVLGLGALTIAGWHLRHLRWVQWSRTAAPLQWLTAVALVGLAGGLLGVAARRRRAALLGGLLGGGIGVVVVVEWIGGWTLIDTLVVRHPFVTTATTATGRPAPNTAIALAVTGAALALIGLRRGQAVVVGGLASVVAGLGAVALFGFGLGLSDAYTWGDVTRMSPQAALAFATLGVGLMAAASQVSRRPGAIDWVPIPVGVGGLVVTLALWRALTVSDQGDLVSVDQAAAAMVVVAVVVAVLVTALLYLRAAAVRGRHAAETTERRLVEFLDNANAVAFAKDLDGRLLLVNRAYEEVLGVRRADVLGRTDEAVLPDGAVRPIRANDEIVVASGEHLAVEERVPDADGVERTFLSSKFPLRDVDGRIYGIGGVATDITERKAAEDALRVALVELGQRSAELERSNAELAEFAYVASHDLREPLRTISGFASLLAVRFEGRLDEDADEMIGFITSGVTRMQRLIDDLLLLSRVDTQARPFAPVDIGALVADVVGVLDPALHEADAEVVVGTLPTVVGERQQLFQVFQNLITNAVKFVAPGVKPHIEIDAVRADTEWQFRVRDNGIGIEPRHREQVFRMFQRLHGRDEYPGTGIGLAIVRKIVQRHGGRIWVDDADGGGSVFGFTVPATPES